MEAEIIQATDSQAGLLTTSQLTPAEVQPNQNAPLWLQQYMHKWLEYRLLSPILNPDGETPKIVTVNKTHAYCVLCQDHIYSGQDPDDILSLFPVHINKPSHKYRPPTPNQPVIGYINDTWVCNSCQHPILPETNSKLGTLDELVESHRSNLRHKWYEYISTTKHMMFLVFIAYMPKIRDMIQGDICTICDKTIWEPPEYHVRTQKHLQSIRLGLTASFKFDLGNIDDENACRVLFAALENNFRLLRGKEVASKNDKRRNKNGSSKKADTSLENTMEDLSISEGTPRSTSRRNRGKRTPKSSNEQTPGTSTPKQSAGVPGSTPKSSKKIELSTPGSSVGLPTPNFASSVGPSASPVLVQPSMLQGVPLVQKPRNFESPPASAGMVQGPPMVQQTRKFGGPPASAVMVQPGMVPIRGMVHPGMVPIPGIVQPGMVPNPGVMHPGMVPIPAMVHPGMLPTPGVMHPGMVPIRGRVNPGVVPNSPKTVNIRAEPGSEQTTPKKRREENPAGVSTATAEDNKEEESLDEIYARYSVRLQAALAVQKALTERKAAETRGPKNKQAKKPAKPTPSKKCYDLVYQSPVQSPSNTEEVYRFGSPKTQTPSSDPFDLSNVQEALDTSEKELSNGKAGSSVATTSDAEGNLNRPHAAQKKTGKPNLERILDAYLSQTSPGPAKASSSSQGENVEVTMGDNVDSLYHRVQAALVKKKEDSPKRKKGRKGKQRSSVDEDIDPAFILNPSTSKLVVKETNLATSLPQQENSVLPSNQPENSSPKKNAQNGGEIVAEKIVLTSDEPKKAENQEPPEAHTSTAHPVRTQLPETLSPKKNAQKEAENFAEKFALTSDEPKKPENQAEAQTSAAMPVRTQLPETSSPKKNAQKEGEILADKVVLTSNEPKKAGNQEPPEGQTCAAHPVRTQLPESLSPKKKLDKNVQKEKENGAGKIVPSSDEPKRPENQELPKPLATETVKTVPNQSTVYVKDLGKFEKVAEMVTQSSAAEGSQVSLEAGGSRQKMEENGAVVSSQPSETASSKKKRQRNRKAKAAEIGETLTANPRTEEPSEVASES